MKNEIEKDAKEKACMDAHFICKGCEFEYPCFQEEMIRNQLMEKDKPRVKPWHIVLFAAIIIFALIGESFITWLLNLTDWVLN